MSALHVLFRVADTRVRAAGRRRAAHGVVHRRDARARRRPYVAGLVQVRSRVVPVVDLRVRFGLPAREPTLDSRIVVVQHGTRAVGLLADSAREVLRIDPQLFQPPPELVSEQAAGFVTQVAELGARLVMLIDSGKVIGEEAPHGEHERQ